MTTFDGLPYNDVRIFETKKGGSTWFVCTTTQVGFHREVQRHVKHTVSEYCSQFPDTMWSDFDQVIMQYGFLHPHGFILNGKSVETVEDVRSQLKDLLSLEDQI